MNAANVGKLTDDDIGNMSEHLAFAMGEASGAAKFAEDVRAYCQKSAALSEALITPEHKLLLNDMAAPGS
jgi:hypothetical protein